MRIVIALLLVVLPAFAHADERRPNILLILTDDMGYADLGCYGSKQIPTPNIDRLAADGVRCTQAYVSGSVCAPSRAGLMTGRNAARFGFEHNLTYPPFLDPQVVALPRNEQTLGSRLSQLGYRTSLIGKWHLGQHADWHHPNARGFAYFFGMLKGGHNYFPTAAKHQLERNGKRVETIATPYLTDWFTQEAIDRMTPGDTPWFVFLSYNAPHTPMQAKDEDLAAFAHVQPERRRIYCAMQRCLDTNVGNILQHLNDTQQRDNTLIVFVNDNGGPTSDNGSLNAPLRGQKSTYFEGGIRVPMIWSWPGRLPTNQTYDQPVWTPDLLPTFLSAAGASLTPEFLDKNRKRPRLYDGVDLLPFLRGERSGERPHHVLAWRMAQRAAAFRDGDWKLIRTPHRGPMLFNLAEDVSEQDDRAARERQRVQAMLRQLHLWECSFERNPMWVCEMRWATHDRELYEMDYVLTQPE